MCRLNSLPPPLRKLNVRHCVYILNILKSIYNINNTCSLFLLDVSNTYQFRIFDVLHRNDTQIHCLLYTHIFFIQTSISYHSGKTYTESRNDANILRISSEFSRIIYCLVPISKLPDNSDRLCEVFFHHSKTALLQVSIMDWLIL